MLNNSSQVTLNKGKTIPNVLHGGLVKVLMAAFKVSKNLSSSGRNNEAVSSLIEERNLTSKHSFIISLMSGTIKIA